MKLEISTNSFSREQRPVESSSMPLKRVNSEKLRLYLYIIYMYNISIYLISNDVPIGVN